MLKDADNKAKPTKYAQNKRHGMYAGTPSMMNLAPERCSAPKTAKGMAKHKLLRTTILSRPPALAISVFAAHSATTKSTMPALHIETAVREISKNVARMVVCIWTPSVAQGVQSWGARSPLSIRPQIVQRRVVTGSFLLGFAGFHVRCRNQPISLKTPSGGFEWLLWDEPTGR